MDKAQLIELIDNWEDSYTEFKAEAAHPDDLAASIVAFANTEGGRLILGVSPDRTISGVTHPDRLMQRVDQICTNNVHPPLVCVQEKVRTNGEVVLVVQISKGPERPYRTNRGVYYIRLASGRRQASREELQRLYQEALALFPDELPVVGTDLSDLDLGYFERSFQVFAEMPIEDTGLPLEKLLSNLKLLKDGKLTIAGLLLFARNPQFRLPYALISAVHFRGNEITEEFLDRKELLGTLEQQITSAETWLKLRLPVAGKIVGFRRQDEHEIPPQVLREAIVNAVVHRDYTIRSTIRIFVFDDRVEIVNPGRLPNTVTLDNIRLGFHAARNPILVTFLSRLGHMSRVGTGIPRMIRLMREAGRPEPEFRVEDAQFRVVLARGR